MPDRSSKEEGRLGRDLEEAKVGECHHFPTIGDHGLGQVEYYGEECKVWISDGQREWSSSLRPYDKCLYALVEDFQSIESEIDCVQPCLVWKYVNCLGL
jgi:hypothetical protein